MRLYHTATIEETLTHLKTQLRGLDPKDVDERLSEYGYNELAEHQKPSALMVFLSQFKDFLVWILIAAGVIALILGKLESTIVIAFVLVLNALLGTFQHLSAEKSMESLKQLSSPTSKVMRGGVKVEIPTRQLVPGDLMALEAGDFIGADARIIESFSVKVNESALTGESEGVMKSTDALLKEDSPLGDRINMVFAGSYVTYGRATAVVTATGMSTELGNIANLIENTVEKKTPLQQTLDTFGQKLAIVILALCLLLLLLSVLRGQPLLNALMFSVSLAVAAIPEALSAIVTIVLAIGTQLMSKQNAIVREIHAVESLGCVSVICSDKTGTLTENRMTVQAFFLDDHTLPKDALDLQQPLHKKLLHLALLCNDAITQQDYELGDPTEIALVKVGDDLNIDETLLREEHQRLQELPFDSDRKLMTTLHLVEGDHVLITKGAVDNLLKRATQYEGLQGLQPMTPARIDSVHQANEQFSQNGLRVLAFGYKPFESNRPLSLEDEEELIFLGLIAMMDPPRAESAAAVEACWQAGIKPIMITGDHKVTATAIAKSIGIYREGDEVLEGVAVEALSDEALQEVVPKVSVYARVSPEHKIRIVKAWQNNGQIVAMTGDGVNDAPALKEANVGIAMGKVGTEVTKEASAIILTDDNFATIVKAIKGGRNIYNNIQSAILFLLSGNTAGVIAVIFTSILALPLPFAPAQLLFINLVTDSLPAIAIGNEKHSDLVMKEKPRNTKRPILTRAVGIKVIIKGLIIAAATLSAYAYGLMQGDAKLAATMAFATFCLGKLFHSLDSRSHTPLLIQGVFSNTWLWGAILVGTCLLHLVLFVPFLHDFFEIATLGFKELLVIYGMALAPLIVIEIMKHVEFARNVNR